MKVVYEAADIVRAIRQELTRQGIAVAGVVLKAAKGDVTAVVEITLDEAAAVPVVEPPAPVPEVTAGAPEAPALAVLEGGAGPVDMSDVLKQSGQVAARIPGRFPVPRTLMAGESLDFPGDKP